MHTYRMISDVKFEVGYYAPDHRFINEDRRYSAVATWTALSTHATEHSAIMRVNFLNGGSSITGI